jgi:glycosyltransferase involved in cell wall biosynthesis
MRVLIVSDRLPPARRGGAGSVLADLAERLAARHDVQIVQGRGDGARARAQLELAVRTAQRRHRPDVALTLGPSIGGLGCPVLVLADPEPARSDRGALGTLRAKVRETRRRTATRVVPTRASAGLPGNEGPTVVCPPGLDVERFAPAAESGDPLRVVFLGRLVASRGAHIALEAVNGLPGWARDRVRFDLVGAASDARYLETLRRNAEGLPCTVHVDVPDPAPLLVGAAVAVLPSTAEDGWGRAILEAMACGLPVVTSKGGVLRDLTGGHAELVPAGNLKAVGDALRGLLKSAERRAELGAAARRHAVAMHGWEVALPRWEQALAEAARG